MKSFLAGFLVLSLALNVFLLTRNSNQASQLKSAETSLGETEELRRQNKELQLHQASDPDATATDSREMIRLRNQVGLLRKQAGDAEPLRTQAAEAAQLRLQLASATQNLATALTNAAKAKEKEKEEAQSTVCVNNLKQIGVAARMWSADNHNVFPQDLFSVRDYLGTPNVLLCPSDVAGIRVKDWAQFNPASISYRFLNLSGPYEESREKVLAMCPIHGHLCMSDGYVQRKQ